MLRVLIVDDEGPARRELRAQLAAFPGVQVVGEAASAPEALQLITAINYDVVFLDIQMPGLSGLEFATRLQSLSAPPTIVFTTAYPQYAVEAFGIGAADYLLKPFDEERLARALTRLEGGAVAGTPSPPPASTSAQPSLLDRLQAERGIKTVLVQAQEIVYAYARDDEVWLKLYDEELRGRRYTLRDLEARLSAHGFLRVHRRFLVNLSKIREVSSLYKASMSLSVNDAVHTEIPVSRHLMPIIKRKLGLARRD